MFGLICLQAMWTDRQEGQDTGVSGQQQTRDAEFSGASSDTHSAVTADEARIRARILHEAFHGALQVMHRDFFREDQKLKLPSKSLEDVFSEMAKAHQIELRWVAVNANAMSINHEPQNDFEREAVAALSSGEEEFERITEETFQYAGSIRLSASCLKCHVHSRTSNDDRKAGLVITIPLVKKE